MSEVERYKPYKLVAQLSLLFCTVLIMLAAVTALTMELVHGSL
ncbi:hypothetical protein ACIOVC_05955 [Pseudomonas neuropathica]